MKSTIAVVVPAKNAESTLCETLQSITACPGVTQIILVNDGSTDDTKAQAQSFNDDRIEIVDGPCTGISGALNAGFDAVRCDYIARCDADDLYVADRFEWQAPVLDANPDIVAVSAGFSTMLEDGTPCGDLACTGEVRDVTEELLYREPVTSFCTWLSRTSVIRKSGGARNWFRTAEDLDLQFRLAGFGPVTHIPRSSYIYRLHDQSIVHSTTTTSREFFDQHAVLFRMQRQESGTDALQRGEDLPSPPQTSAASGPVLSATAQGIGHAVATAWVETERGQAALGLKRLLRLSRKAPMSQELWANIIKISVRIIWRRQN